MPKKPPAMYPSFEQTKEEILELQKQTERSIDRMVEAWGCKVEITFEDEVVEAVRKSSRIGNIRLDNVLEEVSSFAESRFSNVGISDKYVVLIMVARTLRRDDIVRLARSDIPILKRDFAHGINGRKVKGALIYRRIAGATSDAKQATARQALNRGLILVRVVGGNKFFRIKTPDEVSIPARQLKAAK